MPKFDASTVQLETLDWDFRGFGVDAHGVVPEPSDKTIGNFLDGLKRLYESAAESGLPTEEVSDADPGEMIAALHRLTGDSYVKFMADLAGLFSQLCGRTPSAAQILKLPLRVRVKFYGWLQDEVVNPEAGTGAGTAEVRSLPSAAAG